MSTIASPATTNGFDFKKDGSNAARLAAFILMSLSILYPDQAKEMLVAASVYKNYAMLKIAFAGLFILAGKKLFFWV